MCGGDQSNPSHLILCGRCRMHASIHAVLERGHGKWDPAQRRIWRSDASGTAAQRRIGQPRRIQPQRRNQRSGAQPAPSPKTSCHSALRAGRVGGRWGGGTEGQLGQDRTCSRDHVVSRPRSAEPVVRLQLRIGASRAAAALATALGTLTVRPSSRRPVAAAAATVAGETIAAAESEAAPQKRGNLRGLLRCQDGHAVGVDGETSVRRAGLATPLEAGACGLKRRALRGEQDTGAWIAGRENAWRSKQELGWEV